MAASGAPSVVRIMPSSHAANGRASTMPCFHNTQGAEQHAVHRNGKHGCQPNRHPDAQIAEPVESIARPHQARHEGEQRNEDGEVHPCQGVETKQTVQEHLPRAMGLASMKCMVPRSFRFG